ncbi:MAG: cyclopropane-fatty-acyl-phospholipid synthase [Alphaproteobacteria bacterium]|nr:cyclopropane-fatty-acyl-phospholipid synthase [Alphaproteobacteria bacterium]
MTGPTDRSGGCLAPVGAGSPLPRRLRIFQSILNRIERGTIEVVLPDGRRFRAVGGAPGPHGELVVHNPKFLRRLLAEGDLGFGEMFVEGWWATPDLQALLDVIMLNNENMARRFPGAGLVRLRERLRHCLNINSRKGSRRNIAHHYDLGNAFYNLWLDETMTYSSALFRNGQESLGEAQRNKFAAICDRLTLAPGDRILEIGCGWGSFAEYAARERGVRVTGLTISREQQDYARRRLFEAGLAERTEILLRDYRDERGAYDGIASIEMIEAVGEKYWPAYFSALRDRLRPGGVAALQAITIADRLFPQYRSRSDFIQKHIFPGGMLPCLAALRRQADAAGLEAVGQEAFADSYSRTLREWYRRFNVSWTRIATLGFDDRFHRMWNFYLAASAAGFAAGTTDVVQIAFRRPL